MNRSLFATLVIFLTSFLVANAQINISFDVTAPSCDGFTNGRLTAMVDGGTAPYTYAWSSGQSSSTIFSVSMGEYSLTVTDTDGNIATESVSVEAPAPLAVDVTAASSVCDGAATTYTAAASGGTAPYTYTWSNGQTGDTLDPATEDVYYVTVMDANACSNTFPVKVFEPLSVEVVTIATRCPNFCDASAEAVISGGTAPYSFEWNTGSTEQILETLPAGTYTVTVTDGNGCQVVGTGVAEAASDIEFSVDVDGTCGSGDVTAMVNADGGNGDIEIAWSTGDTGMMVSGLEPGETYSVTVTDAAGCTRSEEFTVPNDAGLVLDIAGENLACGAVVGGTATVTPLGGTEPYSIIWSNGELDAVTISNLIAGTYSVTVIDANGCRGEVSIDITASQGLNLEVESTPAICGAENPDGMANVVPSGGAEPYTYSWSDGQTTGTAVGLEPGDYRVTVTDAAGCEGLANVNVGETVDIEIMTEIDASNGSATVSIAGGTEPYSISWSNGQTGPTATGLVAGECYDVMITDANGCMTADEVCIPTSSVDFTFDLTPDCNDSGGTASINIIGGVEPYDIQWLDVQEGGTSVDGLDAGNYTVIVTDANGTERTRFFNIAEGDLEVTTSVTPVECGVASSGAASVEVLNPTGEAGYTYTWSDGAADANRTDLMPGTYSVTVTSPQGCTEVRELTVENSELDLQVLSTTDLDCDGNLGALSVGVANATDVTYTWEDGFVGAERTDLEAGTYTVLATDAAGCEATQMITIAEASTVDATFSLAESMDCETGIITLSATNTTEGGLNDIVWQYGDETITGQDNIIIEIDPSETMMLDLQLSGTSADGCAAMVMQSFSAMEFVLNVDITTSVDVCAGEEVVLGVTNNNPDMELTYQWVPTDLFAEGTSDSAMPTFIGTDATEVTVVVANDMGCLFEQTIPVNITEITAPDLSALTYEESCLGKIINFTGSDELAGYTWDFGDATNTNVITGEVNPSFTYSEPGEYTLTLTPAEGAVCQEAASTNIVVDGPRELEFTLDGNTQFCGDGNPITVTEDFAEVRWYSVDDTETPIFTGNDYTPEPGTYIVEVQNEEGCTGRQEITIDDVSVSYEIQGERSICFGDDLMLNVSNLSVDGITVVWSPNDPMLIDDATSLSPTFMLDETTTFTLTTTNEFGCTTTEEITIEVNELPDAVVSASMDEIFLGQETDLKVDTDGDYSITWESDPTLSRDDIADPVASPEETTTYAVNVTDPETGCSVDDVIQIVVLADPCEQPHIFVPNAFTPNRDGINDMFRVRGLHIDDAEFVVHNRWGEQVYRATAENGVWSDSQKGDDNYEGWDGFYQGEIATGDAFGWYLEVTCFDGTSNILKGNVTILR